MWARAATDAVVAWPGFYIFWVWHNQRAGVSGSRGTLLPRWIFMVFAAVSMGSFCACLSRHMHAHAHAHVHAHTHMHARTGLT